MIDVRVPLAELDRLMAPTVLEHLHQHGLRQIDLIPPASGPEAQLRFTGDGEADEARVEEFVRGLVRVRAGRPPAGLTVLAVRSYGGALGPLRFRREDGSRQHVRATVFDRGANAGQIILAADTWEWIVEQRAGAEA